jgi:hypothetical protein
MDGVFDPSVVHADVEPVLAEPLVRVSQPFVGQWSRLVSTTNWEKGRIILAWRAALEERGLSVTEYSDEAWARLVGGISSQHVGRLRRVYQRFGAVYRQYPDLYWSHFCAALDWDDAEMWLEGAQQSGWSVAQMQRQRWQTLGGSEAPPSPPIASEWDEDAAPPSPAKAAASAPTATAAGTSPDASSGPWIEGPDFGEEPTEARSALAVQPPAMVDFAEAAAPTPPPFENVPPLPDDLAEALDALKLAIVRHRASGWTDVSPQDVLAALDGLKALVTAAS